MQGNRFCLPTLHTHIHMHVCVCASHSILSVGFRGGWQQRCVSLPACGRVPSATIQIGRRSALQNATTPSRQWWCRISTWILSTERNGRTDLETSDLTHRMVLSVCRHALHWWTAECVACRRHVKFVREGLFSLYIESIAGKGNNNCQPRGRSRHGKNVCNIC